MGICKCERRKLTNLFCYKHRVIVCEFCLVASHQKCVVKSYLRWLKDSNFDPYCYICHEDLDQGDARQCARLVCLDVFHWDCLNDYISNLPPTTTPAGYLCPLCSMPIIPQDNQGGPVAETLRSLIAKSNWAKSDILDSPPLPSYPQKQQNTVSSSNLKKLSNSYDGKILDHRLDVAAKQFLAGDDLSDLFKSNKIETVQNVGTVSSNSIDRIPSTSNQLHHQRKDPYHFDSTDTIVRPFEEEDKYKRRTAFRCLSRFLGNPTSKSGLSFVRNRRILMCMALVLTVLFLIISVYRSRQTDITGNPFLDIHMNPNLRMDDSGAKVMLKQNAQDRQFIGDHDKM